MRRSQFVEPRTLASEVQRTGRAIQQSQPHTLFQPRGRPAHPRGRQSQRITGPGEAAGLDYCRQYAHAGEQPATETHRALR
jgi:hypothetical protein